MGSVEGAFIRLRRAGRPGKRQDIGVELAVLHVNVD